MDKRKTKRALRRIETKSRRGSARYIVQVKAGTGWKSIGYSNDLKYAEALARFAARNTTKTIRVWERK